MHLPVEPVLASPGGSRCAKGPLGAIDIAQDGRRRILVLDPCAALARREWAGFVDDLRVARRLSIGPIKICDIDTR
jgi:hypothetical protein